MDGWDQAAQGVVGGFDGAATKTLDDERGTLRNTLYDALLSNPEVAARATKLGRQTGLAPDLVERNLPEIERTTRLDQLDSLPKENPVLASWLSGTANARLAHDDLDNLGQFTNLLRPPAVPKLSTGYGFYQASRDLRAGQDRSASAVGQYVARNMPSSEVMGRERTTLEGITEPVMRGVARARQGLTLLMGMGGMYEGDEAGLMVRLANQNRAVESYPVPESVQQGQQEISSAEGFGSAAWEIITNTGAVKETVLESLGASAPSLFGAAALSVFGPGGTAAGAGMGSFVVEYSSTIQSVLDENGVNASDPMALSKALNNPDLMDAAREKALARGLPIAAFDAITAGFAGKLLMGAKPTVGSAASRTAGELGLQAGGGAAGEATAQYATDEFKPGDILLEAIAELPTGVIEVPANYRASLDRATRAEEQTKTIEQLNQLVASSKVLQRDPETFQTFIEAATEDGPVDTVFVDGRMLMQSGMAPRLADLSPAVREQLDKAVITGGDIAIPVAEYAARIAPTDLAPQLLEHLKTEPDGFTRAEAQDFMANQGAELQAEVERILTDRQDADTFRASQDVVKADILGQLNTAGRFTPQVNEAYATLASAYTAVRAAQLGVTPEAFHQQRGMRVQGAAVAGVQYDQGVDDLGRTGKSISFGKLQGPSGVQILSYDWKWKPYSYIDQRGEDRTKRVSDWDMAESNVDTGRDVVHQFTVQMPDGSQKVVSLESAIKMLGVAADGAKSVKATASAAKTVAKLSMAVAELEPVAAEYDQAKAEVAAMHLPEVTRDGVWMHMGDARVRVPDGADINERQRTLAESWRANRMSERGFKSFAQTPHQLLAGLKEKMAKAEKRLSALIRDPADPNILNQSAYHGSPFKFDKFTLDKIGSGEGAQAYGWGLYFAGKREIAEFYRQTLAPGETSYTVDGEVQFSGPPQGADPRETAIYAIANGGNPDTLAAGYEEQGADPAFVEGVRAAVAALKGKKVERVESQEGQLYEVNIPEDGEYLLWDKPLSEQPAKVRAALEQADVMDQSVFSQYTGEQFYEGMVRDGVTFDGMTRSASQEKASRYLNSLGIAGIKYLDGTSRSQGEGSFNYVIFDENAVEILQTYYQPDGGSTPRGGFSPATNTVTLLKNADLSTFLHESAHYFFESDIQLASELVGKESLTEGEQQIVDDVSKLLTWHGIQGDVTEQLRQWHTMDFEEQRSHHERTAESFEAYLFSGQAPNLELQPIFQRFRAWMVNVYKSLKDFLIKNPEAGKLNDEVRSVFDRMIATQEQIELAEQARSMLPLFANPEQSGMTPEAFAAYQALGADAKNAALDELQAKGLRDMQWLKNAKGKQVARLKRESKALRAEVELEARREVMSQPLYQAWGFLTRKLEQADVLPALERKSDPDTLDPTLDSLFVAIAKLGGIKKDQVISEWGVDPKDMPQSGLFGKPVWRLTDGLTLDGMAAALAEHGYLPVNEHGQYELNDLGDKFLAELAGETQYAYAYQPQDLRPGEQISNPAGLGAGRLDLAGLAAIGAPDEVVNTLKARRMTAKEGLHPDLVATMFDMSSGDELVRALAAATPPKEAITERAEQMMLERHGELATPEAIDQAADAAIHNDARARMVTTEYNALAQATGKPKLLAAAAKEFAAQMIARLKVRDIRPSQYASAETRAAKTAEKASKAGDLATAAAEKRNQLVNVYATRAAYDAKDEVQAGVRYLRKFDKRSKTIDPEYQDQIEAMLERFELRAISNKAVDRRTSLAQWLAAQRESGLEPDIDPQLENEAFRTSYKNMTVEEFRGLVDTIKQIEHLGRLKNKLLTAQDQRAFKVIVDEVSASIIDNGGKARPVELETPTGIRPWLEGFAAGHRKLASLIRQMDGLKDGGPFWRVLVRGMNEAATNEAVMNEQATMALAELYAPLLAMKGGLNGDKVFVPEINDSLTRGGRLSVALNWGNATNRARIMDGDHWNEHQVQAILKTLTREEWRFVNSMWAYIDSYWPQIEAKEKRVTGRAPEKVKADPFTFKMDNGETVELTGGYYPIKYDSNRDDRAEKLEAAEVAKDMMRGAFTRSTTRRGHTKERVEGVRRPVKKTLDVITQHISEVTHDLAWHEWLIDANRLINAKPINQAIREHYGTEVIRTMKDALTGIATADIIPQTKIDTALLYLRANVSRSTMGLSLTTAFLQPFGLAQSMVRIGGKHVLRGMARWAGDASRFESSLTWIAEKSDFMRLRNKTFNRELHEIKGRVSKGHSQARTIYDASLFMLMQKMQMVADVPTWIGAYEKALSENHDDATAVALADQAVLDAQGGGQTKDMSEFQRKHPFLAMFYSYFNTTLNMAAESTAATNFKNPLAVAGWASDMALLMVIPALAPAMLLALMRGEDCEGEECAKKLAQAQAGYLLGTMLGVRELSGSVAGYDYAGPPVGRVINDLGRAGVQVAQGEADEAAVMSSIRLLGTALGIPTTQIMRSYKGWVAWEEGDAPVSSVLMGPPSKD